MKNAFVFTAIIIFSLSLIISGGSMAFSQPEMVDVIVVFNDKLSPQSIQGVGGKVNQQFTIIPAISATVPAHTIDKLQSNPQVSYVEKVMEREFHGHTTTGQTFPWGVDRVDSEEAWHDATSITGSNVKVAVLDTGLDMSHPDINEAWGYSVVGRDPLTYDDKNGHGTHTAGTIAASDNGFGVIGVSPDVDLYTIQISKGSRLSTDNIIAGIEVAIKGPDGIYPDVAGDTGDGADIFNMSFGGGFSNAEKDAIDKAFGYGVLLIASAGNDGCDCANYPAYLDNVVAVASTTSSDSLSSFSNFGSWVDVSAPGSSVYSTYKGDAYATMSGTSMASPHVVGVAALAMQAHPTLDNVGVRALLISSGEQNHSIPLVDAENVVLGTIDGDNLIGVVPPTDPPTGGTSTTATDAYVTYNPKGGKLGVNIELLDESGSPSLPVPNTTVEIQLLRDGNVAYTGIKTTDDNGNAKWNFVGVTKGTYSTNILKVGGSEWPSTSTHDSGVTK